MRRVFLFGYVSALCTGVMYMAAAALMRYQHEGSVISGYDPPVHVSEIREGVERYLQGQEEGAGQEEVSTHSSLTRRELSPASWSPQQNAPWNARYGHVTVTVNNTIVLCGGAASKCVIMY